MDGDLRTSGRHKMDEVDDEEFNIPSLYDDTTYESSKIPDLVWMSQMRKFMRVKYMVARRIARSRSHFMR